MLRFWTLFLLLSTAECVYAQVADSLTGTEPDTLKAISGTTELLRSEVNGRAEDSLVVTPDGNLSYFYNQAQVDYQDIGIRAGYIQIDWATNEALATGIIDSTGNLVQRPIFIEGGKEYRTDTIRYNFESKKARIKKVITKEGEGYLHGERVKKMEERVFYIRGGSFTTCSHEHPHFRLRTSKTKVISGDKIITGPAYLEMLDVPTPLVLPFGFFPTEARRRSGIIIPTYGNNFERGYFLKDGGYYWATNEFMDMTFRGEIYTMGGWGLRVQSNYRKRYRYRGNLAVNFNRIKYGEESFLENGGSFRNSTDFNIRWSHNQDPKARPDLRFSANVNLASASYFQNTQQTANQVLTSQMQSNVSIQKSWQGRPYSLSMNLRHSQNNQQKTIALTLPQLSFNVNRFYPFKFGTQIGEDTWYEKIGMNYSFQAENRIDGRMDEALFSAKSYNKNARYGGQHSASLQTNAKLFKYWTFSPSIRMNSRWYGSRLRYRLIDSTNSVTQDTVRGFNNAFNFSVNANMSTKVYGQFNFRGKVKAIRHVLTPNIGMSYTPDFSDPIWGYYQTYQSDTLGTTRTSSVYNSYLYGSPGKGMRANVNFGLQNTLEMKVKSKRDSTGATKVKLLEGLSLNTSWNAAATSFQWSPVRMSARTSALNGLVQFNFNSSFDWYGIDQSGQRIDAFSYDVNGPLLRRTQSSFNIGFSLNADRFRPDKGKEEKKQQAASDDADQDALHANPLGLTPGDVDYYLLRQYADFDVPWSLNFNFFYTNNKPGLEVLETRSLDVNGNITLTDNWKIGFRTGYDFERKALSYTTINMFRDLHCWQLNVFWVPFGFQRSYTIGIGAKASILNDLKLDRRRGIGDFD
ncbi:MAG: LPS-assembly protein LptD [Flavobacteriia bacterium]|nr:MAG: LPS-assembly protein LptD [Flavobacteriia bacterium]